MTNQRVTLTSQQAAALENISGLWSREDIVDYHIRFRWCDDDRIALSELSLETLISALWIGYDVPKTPEDRILEIYNSPPYYDRMYISTYRAGMRIVLDEMEKVIEGIND